MIVATESVSLGILANALTNQGIGLSVEPPSDFDGDVAASRHDRQRRVVTINICTNIVRAARFLQNCEGTDILYVRPRLLAYPDGISALARPSVRDELFHKLLLICDCLLRTATILELEVLCFDGCRAAEHVGRWLGAEHACTDSCFGSRAAYGHAIYDLTHALRTSTSEPIGLLPLSSPLSFSRGTIATALLVRGWCGPEGDFVWSVGRSSKLKIPTAGGATNRLCTVAGYLFHEDIRLSFREGGTSPPFMVFRKNGLLLNIVFDLGPFDTVFEVEFCYNKTMSPHDFDQKNNDRRSLGFALHTIRIDEASEAHRGLGRWSASEIAMYDPAETGLIYAAGEQDPSLAQLVGRNARILAQNIDRSSRAGDGLSTPIHYDQTSQDGVRQFVSDLNAHQSSVHLLVGTRRVVEVLAATADMDSLASWATFTFVLDETEITPDFLQWILRSKYTMMLEAGRVHAFPEPLGSW